MRKINLFFVSSVFLIILCMPFYGQASLVGTASQATLSVSPDAGSYNPNDTFTLSIFLNTNGQNIVVSAAYLNYDRNSFQAVNIDTNGSVFTSGMENTLDSNNGVIKITRGIPTPGIKTANGLVAKINFKAIYGTSPSSDNFTFSFTAGDSTKSTIIKDDGLGTNILTGVYNGKYTVSGQSNPAPTPTPTPFLTSTPTPEPNPYIFNPLTIVNGTLLKASDYHKVYVVIDKKKKWISTPEVFETLGYKWNAIVSISKSDLAKIPDFEDNLIRAKDTIQVYLVVNGIRRHIPNPDIFLDYGFAWDEVKEVSQSVVNKYRLVRLIKESGQSKIYYLSSRSIKKWVPTPEIFLSFNNKWEDVQVISKKEIESYAESNLMRHNNQIYLIEGTTRRLIPNETILSKYDNNLILDTNKTEFNWFREGDDVK